MTPHGKSGKQAPKILKKIELPARLNPPKKKKIQEEALRRRRGQAKCDYVIEYDDSEFNNDMDDELLHSHTVDVSPVDAMSDYSKLW